MLILPRPHTCYPQKTPVRSVPSVLLKPLTNWLNQRVTLKKRSYSFKVEQKMKQTGFTWMDNMILLSSGCVMLMLLNPLESPLRHLIAHIVNSKQLIRIRAANSCILTIGAFTWGAAACSRLIFSEMQAAGASRLDGSVAAQTSGLLLLLLFWET